MAAAVHVAPSGDDAGPGTASKPFASIGRAQQALREAKGGTAVIHAGTYRLAEPLTFGPEDATCTYAAAPGQTPVISGGRTIKGWKQGEDGVWRTTIADVKAAQWDFRELFVNGERRTRARAPNDGYFRVVKAGKDNRTSFSFNEGDLTPFANLGDVEVVFLHDWSISRVRIAAVDEAARTVRFTHAIGVKANHFRINHFEPHPRYFVENARELLDDPGEWYLYRTTGVVSYLPMPGEDLTEAEVVAPAVAPLVIVKGDPANGRLVERLTFRGLTFSHCASLAGQTRYAAGQAGFFEDHKTTGMRLRMPAAIRFEGAKGCAIEDGRVVHVGGAGIDLEAFCADNRIVGNEIADCGGNGVMVGTTNRADTKSLARNNLVANNHIHHCGRLYFGCVAVWVGITDGTAVRHNEIAHHPYTGVSVGWMWNTKPTPCANNVVEANHIHHVMQILSDGGGIYTLGRQPGTVLRGNHIHDVPVNAGRAESNGMFIDQGSSLLLIEGNTIHAVARSPIRFHQATTNTVRGNTLTCGKGVPPFRYNRTDPKSITYEDNTILSSEKSVALWGGARTQGRVGRALKCNGIDTHLAVPHAPALDPKHLTAAAWVAMSAYPTGPDNRRWIFNKNRNEWVKGHWGLVVAGRNAGAYLNIGGGKENCRRAFSDSAPLTLNRWHHLAMTYDGRTLAVYVDGAPAGSAVVGKPRTPGRSPLDIGMRQDGHTYFTGAIDEVRLYNRALAPAEIKALAAEPGAVGEDKSLVGRWTFDEEPAKPPAVKAADTAGLEPPYRERLLPPVRE